MGRYRACSCDSGVDDARMLTLTSTFAFSSAHRLDSSELDDQAKQETYGPCLRIHGHNYHLEIAVTGDYNPQTGFFCNVMELKAIVNRLIVNPWDHRLLNDITPFTDGIATMERIALVIRNTLIGPLAAAGMTIDSIRLGETPEHWVTIQEPLAESMQAAAAAAGKA